MLAYTKRGEGSRAVIMLHGFLGAGRNLGSLARMWIDAAPDRTVVLPDLGGHGTSPALPPGADLGTLAEQVLALADHLGLGSPLEIVGHSLGGRVALRARQLDPARVEHVVLLDSPPATTGESTRELEHVVRALLAAPETSKSRRAVEDGLRAHGLTSGLVAWLSMNLVTEGEGVRWRIDRSALAALLERTRGKDLWPVVEGPGGVIELVRGARSNVVSQADAERMVKAGRRVVTIPDAGHFLHVDRPSAVLAALLGKK